ncbi:hypothetical protein DPEC_G00161930 [Dallia pectoralis]|uniref:Uncharacterized protein n=1 Tax=Dallia pectoralis TaxID=75939 RepID=A0ACC2GGY6_DALPE|nr:hypothetical protein DPEC_G00161930 [Dallia pectoralis]
MTWQLELEGLIARKHQGHPKVVRKVRKRRVQMVEGQGVRQETESHHRKSEEKDQLREDMEWQRRVEREKKKKSVREQWEQ